MVRLEAVHKRYPHGPVVLAGIDLDVPPCAPVIVRGANGSGKSTLLRIAAGAATPTRGRVLDRPRIVGYLPDRFPALLRLSVGAYLRHLAAVHGAPRAQAAAEAADLLAALRCTAGSATPMAQLSKGNAQKVGLAQALCCGAALLVLDEPWSGLDVEAAAAVSEKLDATAAEGVGLLIADHTGLGARLAGTRRVRLVDGVLAPDSVPVLDLVHVELRCPDSFPEAILRGLPAVAASSTERNRLLLRVPAEQSDALLAAALARGCSVVRVWREADATPRNADRARAARIGGAEHPRPFR